MSSLSEIQQWKPDDMDELSRHFNELADSRGNTMDAIQRSADNLNWTGAGNDGKTLTIAGHAAVAATHAQILRATAGVAQAGGQALYGQQQLLVTAVQDAEDAGFDVDDDFNVTDPDDPMGFRDGIAAAIEADLLTQAEAFDAQRMTTATEIGTSSAALAAPTGKVQCFGPEDSDGAVNCFEPDGKGGGTTFKGIWAQEGVWPDKAQIAPPSQGVQMMDHTFKTGGGDEPPMPPVGGDPNEDMLISTQSGAASTQSGLGSEDTRLPAMPKEWPPAPPSPSPTCTTDEFYKILTKATEHTAVEAGGVAILPETGPAVIPGIVGLIVNGNNIADDVGDAAHCFNEGVGN